MLACGWWRVWVLTLTLVAVSGCAKPELIVLLESDGGQVGALEVQSDGQNIVLQEAFAGAQFSGVGEYAQVEVDKAQLYNEFAAALAATPEQPVQFVLYFEEGTTNLVAASKPQVQRIFAEIASRQAPDVQVTGHTDTVGTIEDNDKLALRRANSVREMLIAQGLQPALVAAVGRGERAPLVATGDEVDEPKNRRVVVIVR